MTSNKIQIETHLDSADLSESHDLYAILSSALKNRAVLRPISQSFAGVFWPASFFHLDRVAIFEGADQKERNLILEACSRNLLEEAYCIEKCGMYFASKMSLLSESTQERMLYSLFAADEAIHFSWIKNYVSVESAERFMHEPFIKLLDEVLREGDKITLTYIIQVILEGWGISHYRTLSKDCIDAELVRVFDQIIKDEARHHRSGVVLFNEKRLSRDQINSIIEALSRLFFMVRTGPQSVVSKIERIKGHLSRAQKIKIFEEMECETETAKKIKFLKSLIGSAGYAEKIFDELARRGSFKPLSAIECAEANG